MEHPIIRPYSKEAIEQIHRSLLQHKDQGEPKEYTVLVDALEVIARTADPAYIEMYGNFITDESEQLTVKLWQGSSNRFQTFTYRLKPGAQVEANQSGTLDGLDMDARISERLDRERTKWKLEQYEKQVEELEAEVAEKTEAIEELEEALADMLDKKPTIAGMDLGQVAGAALEGLIRRNPHIIAKLPGGEALAGIIEEDNAQTPNAPPPDQGEASVKMKEKNAGDSAVEADDRLLQFAQELRNSFDEEELQSISQILAILHENHALIRQALEYLLNKHQGHLDEEISFQHDAQ